MKGHRYSRIKPPDRILDVSVKSSKSELHYLQRRSVILNLLLFHDIPWKSSQRIEINITWIYTTIEEVKRLTLQKGEKQPC